METKYLDSLIKYLTSDNDEERIIKINKIDLKKETGYEDYDEFIKFTVNLSSKKKIFEEEKYKNALKVFINDQVDKAINKCLEKVINLLLRSLLRGEFLLNTPKFYDKISSLKKLVSFRIEGKIGLSTDIENLIERRGQNHPYRNIIVSCIEAYTRIAEHICQISFKAKQIVLFDYSDNTKDNLILRNQLVKEHEIEEFEALFYIGHDILKRDAKQKFNASGNNSINEAKECLIELFVIREKLNNLVFKGNEINAIKSALKEKCNFIILKYIYTLEKRREKHESYYKVGHNGKYFLLDPFNFEFKSSSRDLIKLEQYCWLINNDNLNLYPYFEEPTKYPSSESEWYKHYLSYKSRQCKSIKESKELYEKAVVEEKNIFSFEGYASKIRKNFLFNSYFDLLLESHTKDGHEFYSKQHKELKEKFPLSGENVQNFYPFYKLYLKLNEYLKELTDGINLYLKNEGDENRQDIDTRYTSIKNIIKLQGSLLIEDLFPRLDWCRKNYFYKYQLSPQKCIYRLGENPNEVEMLIISSFVLPIDYDNIYKKIDSTEHERIAFSTLNEQKYSYYKANDDVNKKVIEFKEEGEKNQKNIQNVIAILLAVTAIIIGGSNILKQVTDFNEGILYLGFYAFIFYLFFASNSLFNKSRDQDFKWITKNNGVLVFFGLLLAIVLSWGLYQINNRGETSDIVNDKSFLIPFESIEIGKAMVDSTEQKRIEVD